MSEAEVMGVLQDALWTTLLAIAPAMIASVAVGLVVALAQAVTQVQESTLTYVPKIVAVFVTLALTSTFMFQLVAGLMQRVADRIIAL
jgi:flagellar biosynthetic protein FliQ